MNKKEARVKRSLKTRKIIKEVKANRLAVHRTPRHIYAQVFSVDGSSVICSASTVEKEIKAKIDGYTGNTASASVIGTEIAKRALGSGVTVVAFDRSGFRYHGRVKALAEAARAAGLSF